MLSQTLINEILNSLTNRYFDQEDFTFSQQKLDYGVGFLIQYRYQKDCFFNASTNGKTFSCEFSPGSILEVQEERSLSTESLFGEISSWLNRLNDFMCSSPMTRKILQNQAKIEEIEKTINEKLGDLKGDFTNEEIVELKDKLDKLENEFRERLEEQITDTTSLSKQLDQLHKDVQKLKTQAHVLNKKNWLLSFSTKLYLLGQKNPQLIVKPLMHMGYNLLPESVQKIMSVEMVDSTIDSLLPEPSQVDEVNTQKGNENPRVHS